MLNTQFIETLRSLSGREFAAFEAYLRSPYFNTNPRNVRLWEALQPFAPTFDAPGLEREAFWAVVYPDAPYDYQRWRDDVSAMHRLLKGFLVQEELQRIPHETTRLLLHALRERKQDKLFEREAGAFAQQLATGIANEQTYFLQAMVANERNQHFGQRQINTADDSLLRKMTALDSYYLYVKLRDSCEMLNRNQLFATQFLSPMMPDLLALAEGHYSHIPQISLYALIYRLLSEPHTAHFQPLLLQLDALRAAISTEELRAMYKYAQNYCIRQINAGNSHYMAEIFRLYQALLHNELLFTPEGEISHTDYKNIATAALRQKAFEWATTFIADYAPRIAQPHRENAHTFCRASLLAETAQHKAAIKLLQQVQPTDVFYYLSARDLLLKLYYETQEYDTLHYQIEAYSLYLKRNAALSAAQIVPRAAFLRFAKRLARLADSRAPRKQFEALAEKIAQAPNVANVAWLREKIAEAK